MCFGLNFYTTKFLSGTYFGKRKQQHYRYQLRVMMGNAVKCFEWKPRSRYRRRRESLKFNNADRQSEFVPVHVFKFMKPFEDHSTNGLYFNNIFFPEEIVANILSHVPPKILLELTLVCRKWCNIIKSENFWMDIYNRQCPNKAKKLPWYVYYCYFATNNFENLLKNENGQEQYKYWETGGNVSIEDQFGIEDPPTGADPLPLDVPEFAGHTSCFAGLTNYSNKIQIISFRNKRLLRYIINKFRPHIYASEWVAKRDDCGRYSLIIKGYNQISEIGVCTDFNLESAANTIARLYFTTSISLAQLQGACWKKMQLLAKNYPPHVAVLVFEHKGTCKMAGGVLQIIFDSIQPLEDVDQSEYFKMDI